MEISSAAGLGQLSSLDPRVPVRGGAAAPDPHHFQPRVVARHPVPEARDKALLLAPVKPGPSSRALLLAALECCVPWI